MRNTRALVLASVAACWNQPEPSSGPAAPVPFADLVPVRDGERVLDAAPAWSQPANPSARFAVRTSEAVAVGDPIEVILEIVEADVGSTNVEVALVGPGTNVRVHDTLRVEPEPFQGCDPVHSASECDRSPRTSSVRVVVGRATALGEHVVTGRVLDGRARHEPRTRVRVVSKLLAPAYRLHATGGAGPYRLRARGVVETTFAGQPLRVSRGVYDRDGQTLLVDITADLGDRAEALAARLPGQLATTYGEREVRIHDTGAVRETSWVTHPQDGTRLLRVIGPASGEELVEYELRMRGPWSGPRPGRAQRFAAPPPATRPPAPPPALPRPPPPRPSRACRADMQHCCRPDGTLVVPGGCQPSYPDHVQPATRRGNDGSCVQIECHLKCLPADAAIATPLGPVAVSRLRIGDLVWTATANGARVAAPLLAIQSIPLPGDHAIALVRLDDGRTLRASSSHPLVDGTLIGALVVGALVDGARVTAIETSRYRGATWDLLPAGETGTYWADSVRLGSTLHGASRSRP